MRSRMLVRVDLAVELKAAAEMGGYKWKTQ